MFPITFENLPTSFILPRYWVHTEGRLSLLPRWKGLQRGWNFHHGL